MTSNNSAANASTSTSTSKTSKPKAGPVKTYRPAEVTAADLSAAAAAAAPLPFEALTMPEMTGKKKGKGDSGKGERIRIDWPQNVVDAAEQLKIQLTEYQPVKGHSPAGMLLTNSRAAEEITQVPIRNPQEVRQDQQAVWALWVAHGASGAVPAMAQGEALPLFDLMRGIAGAPPKVRKMAAFKRLWSGAGDAGSILSQLAKHTGRTVKLDLAEWTVTLADQHP